MRPSKHLRMKVLSCIAIVAGVIGTFAVPTTSMIWRLTMGLLIFVGAIGLAFTTALFKRSHPADEAPEKESWPIRRAIFSGQLHEFRHVSPETFSHLDYDFYRRATASLQQLGFKILDDLENVTLARPLAGTVSFTRVLVDGDGTTIAGVRHFKPRNASANEKRVIEFLSEFSDGSFVVTNNEGKSTVSDVLPGLTTIYCSSTTPLEEILRVHRVAALGKNTSTPPPLPTRIRDTQDYIQLQHRLHAAACQREKANNFKRLTPREAVARNIIAVHQALYSDRPHTHRIASHRRPNSPATTPPSMTSSAGMPKRAALPFSPTSKTRHSRMRSHTSALSRAFWPPPTARSPRQPFKFQLPPPTIALWI